MDLDAQWGTYTLDSTLRVHVYRRDVSVYTNTTTDIRCHVALPGSQLRDTSYLSSSSFFEAA